MTSRTEITHSSNRKPRKRLVIALITVLLLIAALAAILFIVQRDTTSDQPQSSTTSDTEPKTPAKKVVASIPTTDKNIDLQIYTPRQTETNTTIDFALKNTCTTDCGDKSYANEPYHSTHKGFNFGNIYIINDATGIKYNVITDDKDQVLVTPQCSGYVEPGKKLDCFVAFTKVPSGSTVSVVFRDVRLDNIQIP